MLVALSRRMGLDARELRTALWLGAALMTVTSSYTLVKTARDSLFLSTLPATWLPWVYILVGIVTLAVSLLFGRLTQWLSPRQSLVGSVLAAAAGSGALQLRRLGFSPVGPGDFLSLRQCLRPDRRLAVLAVRQPQVRPARDEENGRRCWCRRHPRGHRRRSTRVGARRMASSEMVDRCRCGTAGAQSANAFPCRAGRRCSAKRRSGDADRGDVGATPSPAVCAVARPRNAVLRDRHWPSRLPAQGRGPAGLPGCGATGVLLRSLLYRDQRIRSPAATAWHSVAAAAARRRCRRPPFSRSVSPLLRAPHSQYLVSRWCWLRERGIRRSDSL